MADYAEKSVNNWGDFFQVILEYTVQSRKKWIFRGHYPGEPLKSSLERAVQYYPKKLKNMSEAEIRLVREFKRRYHQYSSDVPKDNDYLEWFSIMQHYGAPTRLVDFTYSIYAASYFALEHTCGKPFEVFAVDLSWAINECAKKFPRDKDAEHFFKHLIGEEEKERVDFIKYFMTPPLTNFVCPFNPFRLTERITIQKGLFLCPGNVDETFDNNLKSLPGWEKEENVVKFVLEFNEEEIIKAREHLFDLNITRATLFPGLEGFAKSLAIYPLK